MTRRLALGLCLAMLATWPSFADGQPPDPAMTQRLEELEAQTRELRQQLDAMRQASGAPAAPAAPVSPAADDPAYPTLVAPSSAYGATAETAPSGAPTTPPAPAPAPGAAPAAAPPEAFYSMDELKTEMRKLVWTKGDFKIVPYGILWGNSVYETARTQPGDYTFYVLPERANTNEQVHVDGRSTRLGVDVSGPQVPLFNCAASGGKVEVDFQRLIDTENRSGILLRHAYVEVKDDEFRLLIGQTWDAISPLYPGMLMYSVGWGGGNIGYRRAQIRGERYLDVSDTMLFTVTGSLNADILQEFSGTGFAGDQAGWPVLMGRIGTTLGDRGPGCRPVELGISAHVGEEIFDFRAPTFTPDLGVPKRTWSLNGDVKIPFTQRFGVQGEFFMGENLGPYLGGILQGVDVGTVGNVGTFDPIRSIGGWVDVWYDWNPRLHSHAGFGIDDPRNNDLTAGRTYNSFTFANISYDLTQKFLVGFETSYWKTFWVNQPNGEAVAFEVAMKYGF
jgi:hypothetical protein